MATYSASLMYSSVTDMYSPENEKHDPNMVWNPFDTDTVEKAEPLTILRSCSPNEHNIWKEKTCSCPCKCRKLRRYLYWIFTFNGAVVTWAIVFQPKAIIAIFASWTIIFSNTFSLDQLGVFKLQSKSLSELEWDGVFIGQVTGFAILAIVIISSFGAMFHFFCSRGDMYREKRKAFNKVLKEKYSLHGTIYYDADMAYDSDDDPVASANYVALRQLAKAHSSNILVSIAKKIEKEPVNIMDLKIYDCILKTPKEDINLLIVNRCVANQSHHALLCKCFTNSKFEYTRFHYMDDIDCQIVCCEKYIVVIRVFHIIRKLLDDDEEKKASSTRISNTDILNICLMAYHDAHVSLYKTDIKSYIKCPNLHPPEMLNS